MLFFNSLKYFLINNMAKFILDKHVSVTIDILLSIFDSTLMFNYKVIKIIYFLMFEMESLKMIYIS